MKSLVLGLALYLTVPALAIVGPEDSELSKWSNDELSSKRSSSKSAYGSSLFQWSVIVGGLLIASYVFNKVK